MKKKEKAKELWEICFNDNPLFTELYFQKRYTDENTISIMDGERMTSVLQLLSYPFKFHGQIVPSSYISGACTHPDYRKKGIMHQLLEKSCKQLQDKNIPICTLIPANDNLFIYYQKSGFETVFFNTAYNLDLPKEKKDSDIVVTFYDQFNQKSYNYFDKRMNEIPAVILHTKEDFEVILADLRLAQGQVFTAHKGRDIVGIALAYYDTEDKSIHVNEILADSRAIQHELFHTMYKYFGTKSLYVISPPLSNKKEKFGMLRIIQVKPILEIFAKALPKWKDEFFVEDPLLSKNEGFYTIKEGIVSFKKTKKQETHTVLSINELATKLFMNLEPYMSLMLD